MQKTGQDITHEGDLCDHPFQDQDAQESPERRKMTQQEEKEERKAAQPAMQSNKVKRTHCFSMSVAMSVQD